MWEILSLCFAISILALLIHSSWPSSSTSSGAFSISSPHSKARKVLFDAWKIALMNTTSRSPSTPSALTRLKPGSGTPPNPKG